MSERQEDKRGQKREGGTGREEAEVGWEVSTIEKGDKKRGRKVREKGKIFLAYITEKMEESHFKGDLIKWINISKDLAFLNLFTTTSPQNYIFSFFQKEKYSEFPLKSHEPCLLDACRSHVHICMNHCGKWTELC